MERVIGSSHYRSTLSRPTLVKVRAQGKKFFNFSTEQMAGKRQNRSCFVSRETTGRFGVGRFAWVARQGLRLKQQVIYRTNHNL
jgi:hypothetical protein